MKAKAAINVDVEIMGGDDFDDIFYSLLSREMRTIKDVNINRASSDTTQKAGHVLISLILVPVQRSGDSSPGAYAVSLTVTDGFQCASAKPKGVIAALLMTKAYLMNNQTERIREMITKMTAQIDAGVFDQYR